MDSEVLGIRIREARERLRLSQEELAVAVSKDQHAISQYENGNRKLAVTDLPAFARALKVPILYFFEGEIATEDVEKIMVDAFRHLPTLEAKKAIIEFIRIFSDTLEPYHRS